MNMIFSIIFTRGRDGRLGTAIGRSERTGMRTARARHGMTALAAAGLAALGLAAAACGSTVSGSPLAGQGGSRVINVVAGENFWGSLVSQLGGTHVLVFSIVSDPNADPHDYESSSVDARAVAAAGYVVQNGAGYDDWMTKLLAASPAAGRRVYDIGASLGKRSGDNLHLWYDPVYVTAVCDHIEADLKAIDSKDVVYFTVCRAVVTAAFAGIRARIA